MSNAFHYNSISKSRFFIVSFYCSIFRVLTLDTKAGRGGRFHSKVMGCASRSEKRRIHTGILARQPITRFTTLISNSISPLVSSDQTIWFMSTLLPHPLRPGSSRSSSTPLPHLLEASPRRYLLCISMPRTLSSHNDCPSNDADTYFPRPPTRLHQP